MSVRVTVVGSVNMDLVVHADHVPAPGENVFGSNFQMIPGGKGANQAVAAARLGAEVSFVGRVCRDAFGRRLAEGLREAGVRTTHLKTSGDEPSGTALIVVDRNGQNSIVICRGANGCVGAEDVDAAADTIRSSDVLLLQFEIPLETVGYAIERAREWRVPVVLDAGPPCPHPPEAVLAVDVLTPNEAEAAALVGRDIVGVPDAEAAARALITRGAGSVVVKLGAQGALLVAPDDCLHVPAHPITPVDTTAAGDAFTAALAVYATEGRSLAEAVRMANSAGALACLKPGAQLAMPTREAVETFAR